MMRLEVLRLRVVLMVVWRFVVFIVFVLFIFDVIVFLCFF